jgi:hypothetical protein
MYFIITRRRRHQAYCIGCFRNNIPSQFAHCATKTKSQTWSDVSVQPGSLQSFIISLYLSVCRISLPSRKCSILCHMFVYQRHQYVCLIWRGTWINVNTLSEPCQYVPQRNQGQHYTSCRVVAESVAQQTGIDAQKTARKFQSAHVLSWCILYSHKYSLKLYRCIIQLQVSKFPYGTHSNSNSKMTPKYVDCDIQKQICNRLQSMRSPVTFC